MSLYSGNMMTVQHVKHHQTSQSYIHISIPENCKHM